MIANKLIPVCSYLRMSSDAQEYSLSDQRKEIAAYCRSHGYRIVKEFVDAGISGWKSKERKGFLQLIDEAPRGEWQQVVVWDQARFSRFDVVEFMHYIHILRTEGVGVESVKEGPLRFDALGDWLQTSVRQDAKLEYVKTMAIDVARGQRRERAKGLWIGPNPYGYRNGPQRRLMLGPAQEVDTVRRVYQLRLQGMGMRRIAGVLNAEGIKPQRGSSWHAKSIRKLLTNTVLVGDTVVGALSRPKFAKKAEVTVHKSTHPAIISREDFAKVQALWGNPRSKTGKKHGSPLGGLLRCAHCGRTMYTDRRINAYVCGTYHSRGQCSYNKLRMDVVLRAVAGKVREHVLYGTLERLTEAVEVVLAKQRSAVRPVDAAAIRKQIAGIDAKLEAAAERLMEVDRSLVKQVEAKMLDLRRQREALQERLSEQPKPKKVKSAKAIAGELWRLDDLLSGNNNDAIRTALHQIIDHMEVRFEAIPSKGKRIYHKPLSADLHFAKRDTPSGQCVPLCKTVVKLTAAELRGTAV